MNEYDQIAQWYDAYVRVDQDLKYFTAVARGANAVMDLMAGTGRVSIALAEASSGTVTCIDRSRGMLRGLQRKARRGGKLRPICADVCDLPAREGFDVIVIPFNSLAEPTPTTVTDCFATYGGSSHRVADSSVRCTTRWYVAVPWMESAEQSGHSTSRAGQNSRSR